MPSGTRWLTAVLATALLASCSAMEVSQSGKVRAQGAPVTFGDPDDVNLALDLKTLTHENDAQNITYTAVTYEPFDDQKADFKWAIDTNGDQKIDRLVSAEWEGGKLVGKVEDTRERELGAATVTRNGAHGLRVTFAHRLLGVGEYQYRVLAVTDTNRNDEDDPGEVDLAPDTGFWTHRL